MRITAKDIVMEPSEVLRQKAAEVELPLSRKDRQILLDLITYVRNSRDEEYREKYNIKASVGIAAPQIGVSKKMLAVSIKDDEDSVEFALVNPKIVSNSTQKAYLENGESCLSVSPDVEGIVPRYAKVTVRAYNLLTDRVENIRLTGYPAIVMQHEIDHLYGLLYHDHINKKDPWAPIPGAIVI
ncbi:MAG: peptide deformylase [Erysipelotrichaceae bacterium]|nr:peptide deformylase [Erysipelotrichaceae bacterium]